MATFTEGTFKGKQAVEKAFRKTFGLIKDEIFEIKISIGFWDEEVDPELSQIINKKPKNKYRYRSSEVGSFSPNGLGLYDMSSIAAEWCCDWY